MLDMFTHCMLRKKSENRVRSILYVIGIMCMVCSVWAAPVSASAQSAGYEDIPYSEMFTEGKEWTLCHFGLEYNHYINPERLYKIHAFIDVKVDGEAIIEGINCKRLKIDVKMIEPYCWDCYCWLDREGINEEKEYGYEDVPIAIPEEVYVYEKDRRVYFYRNPGFILENHYDIKECEPFFQLYMDFNKSVG